MKIKELAATLNVMVANGAGERDILLASDEEGNKFNLLYSVDGNGSLEDPKDQVLVLWPGYPEYDNLDLYFN